MKSSAPEPCLTDAPLVRCKRTHADEKRKQSQHPSAIPFTNLFLILNALCFSHFLCFSDRILTIQTRKT